MTVEAYTKKFTQLGMHDLESVGGKNASLGEMISHLTQMGVNVPTGFATTVTAFKDFLQTNHLDTKIYQELAALEVDDIALLSQAGQKIRQWITTAHFSNDFISAIESAYKELQADIGHHDFTVAVRSSATAEDLPDASFAGQQETFLNVSGIPAILTAIKEVFASLFNDRAISYRSHQGFAHDEVAISVGIQQMVRSDLAASGVMFTMDTESGFNDVVFITSAYGLGELVVQGAVNPDEFYVHKANLRAGRPAIVRKILGSKALKMIYGSNPHEAVVTKTVDKAEQQIFSLTDRDVEALAQQALIIEKHYGRPMDIEWGKDGQSGQIYILQARPETVRSRTNTQQIERYTLNSRSTILAEGRSIGQRIGQGKARIIHDISEMHRVKPGDVLISDMTDPDWEPVMKRAAAIVTNRGGRTCHAAIIARELGIPAVVGCGDATDILNDGDEITVSCADGDTGYIYEGLLAFERITLDVDSMPDLPLKVMLNVGNPERAFAFQAIPNAGVGLARLEFLISNTIGIHPKALLNYDTLSDETLKTLIDER
ncbi:MAG TPA: phosphoenolpyruvate synthase, partial [Legionellales bacterium]|nr:phosphoenolpyruvate synthase [Legionellales bacterium]